MKKYSIWLLGFAALVAGACSTDRTGDETLALSASSVSANKRGMTYEGGDVTFDVLSNVYWVINLDEDADWLTVAPRAAYGNQTVKVTAAVNPGGRRSTTLRFDSLDGVTAQIEVTQGSSDELIYYISTGAGASAVAEPVAVGGYTAWEPEGVGASAVGFSGVNAFVSADTPSSGYDEASGGNNIVLEVPGEGSETVTPSFSVRDVATRDDSYFRLKMGVLAPGGELTPDRFRVLVGNGGDELIALQYEVIDGAGDWKEVLARFWVGEDNPTFDFKVEAPAGGYRIDDFRLYEGNFGEGQEVAFQVGGDDGKPEGYVYFEDDFSWVTDVYGGTDYIGTYPTPLTAETYWNGITAASHGQEAYNALVGSGWKTDDNKLKERVYLRIGYVKMGRGSNAAGCGGGLVSPTLDIRKNRAADLKVTFKCCIYVAANGTWDPSTMQVRVIGPGTVNDGVSTEKVLVMQTETPVQWEEKTLIVYGATDATQLVFESVEETKANRWFLDDVRIVKAGPDDKPSVDLIPLAVPAVTFDQDAATESSVKFTWTEVSQAAEYEYSYTCLNCGEVVASRSGKTTELSAEFTGLIAGTSARLTVRALPAEGDKTYKESAWSDPVEGDVKSSGGGLPQLATPSGVTVSANSAYGFEASWAEVSDATDYTYFVELPNGQVVATGKTWEPRVHIGGLAGKNFGNYPYFNFRVVANHMNYNSSKVEIPQTFRSSEPSAAVRADILPSTATVYFQDDFSWADPWSGSALLATNTDWINTYCTVDTMVRLDLLEKEGTVSLNGWGYDATNKSVYTRPGYIHLNSSSALGNLITPAFTGITGTDDVKVSFDATYFFQYFSGAADTNKTLTASLKGAGTIEGASGGIISFTLSRGNAWEGFSFTITGADATTRVVFAPAVKSKNRVQFDNFRAESLTR